MGTKSQISLKGVRMAFGDKRVLDGIDLEIGRGKTLQIIGPSGCGKSVTMKIILDILRQDEGEVYVEGEAKVGTLFQYSALFDSMNVWQNIAFYQMYHKGISNKRAQEIARHYLRQVGLSAKIWDTDPAYLSGGMRKRVALARALAVEPDILICDEPTSGLDPVTGSHINGLIGRIVKKNKCTAIIITHDMKTVETLGGSVVMLYGGKVVWQGSAGSVKGSKNSYIRQFADHSTKGPISVVHEE